MARPTSISITFLIVFIGYSQQQTPPRCALSRLDIIPCPYKNRKISRAGENQYSIHTTKIISTLQSQVECRVTPVEQAIQEVETINNNMNAKFIHSPGYWTNSSYSDMILAEYRIVCDVDQEIYYKFIRLDIQPKDCIFKIERDGVKSKETRLIITVTCPLGPLLVPRCSDYILIDRGDGSMTEICGNFSSNGVSDYTAIIPSNSTKIIFRSDEQRGNFLGFGMVAVCYNPNFCNIQDCLQRFTFDSCVLHCNDNSITRRPIKMVEPTDTFTEMVEPIHTITQMVEPTDTFTEMVEPTHSITEFMVKPTDTFTEMVEPTITDMVEPTDTMTTNSMRSSLVEVYPAPSNLRLNENTVRDDTLAVISPPLAAAIGVSIFTLTTLPLIFVIGICCCIRRKKRKARMKSLGPCKESKEKEIELNVYRHSPNDKSHDQLPEEPPVLDQDFTSVELLKRDLLNKKMLFSGNELQLGRVIGEGESGLVYRGYIRNGETVAIKTARVFMSAIDKRKLLREMSIMMSFNHPNVMSLIGMCFDDEVPLLIMPFMSDGNVLDYVRKKRDLLYFSDQYTNEEVISARKKCLDICHQIAKGMSYLAMRRFVHRDLAARNCMIDGLTQGVIKVADFGLTEDMYGTNYYRKSYSESEERVPIRWMAPESIESNYYNEATDVWSFGITCWEIMTCGGVPYAGLPARTLLTELRSGHRIERPSNAVCSDEIWGVIQTCWTANSIQRPKFNDVVNKLFDLLDFDNSYLKLQ